MDVTTDAIIVLITASSDQEADGIARLLVEKRVAACVNAVSGVRSLYWWQGSMDSARETLLIAKTRTRLMAEVIKLVKQVHSYSVPEIVALPIIGGNKEYLDWLSSEATGSMV
ncbi:MAG: divalent-cation tolerance protein CutA [Chloroflexi bacterium]|nr:divalent-cation tolerance protein CutA [Chloroflexota bacterium]